MSQDIQKVLIEETQINERCKELAAQIEADYQKRGQVPVIVGLLKGSVPFMAELIKRFTFPCEIDFMSVSSYDGTESIGDVRIDKDMDLSCKGREVLIVEDIVDTGRTLREVKKLLKRKGAADVKVVSLLDKPERRVVEIEADYIGFRVPDEFVVGYGLDYNQKYRNLPYIGVLKPEVYR
ncbi:hypoxanthine phosphoribosyltransferase [Faecalicoccus acidiformans]|uniref:hypoxanthine phosphoribosyltransferase n=1 Tax=uncultured Faecalicoccus sp. TaxID=1971760 RepID=UPI001955FED9|nr:hypoxanthine phosphoribosyltransferase [Faecalicoccus acidiformans]MDM8203358.1 hypoxanthine phosphoribosyltransferase [Faecalicoccus acidiformans]HIW17818.1 hypoxanthine phosphoribosyltransferase [Candidatus Faecalicoccus intestinipullorum]